MLFRQAFCHGLWFPAKSEFMYALGCLNQNEINLAMRFAYQRDVLSSIVGKLLIRNLFVQHLEIPNSTIQIERTSDGRPYVDGYSNKLDFNISHGGDFTVLAGTSAGRCGIDVMQISLPPSEQSAQNFIKKMKNVFSSYELNYILSGTSDSELMRRFYRHWCLKEAYLKTLGCGLRLPLKHIECHFFNTNSMLVTSKFGQDTKTHWIFEEHHFPQNHLVILAWCGSLDCTYSSHEDFCVLDFTQLTENLTVISPTTEDFWDEFTKKLRAPPSCRRQILDI